MAISWNEIKSRAVTFSKEWESEGYEKGEAQSFWNGFFDVFGISRRRVASFEYYVERLGKKGGFIDLYWPGTLIAEAKSVNEDLDKAYSQAMEYLVGLNERDLPKYILISDFANIILHDLEENTVHKFLLKDLVKNVNHFAFIAGYKKREYKPEDPVNIRAAELMGKLYDSLLVSNYDPHCLKVFLVRILFCLFADDTMIFEKGIFREYIENKTKVDGSDMGMHLGMLFQILNTPENLRSNALDEDLSKFPYVNGKLFEEVISFPSFNSEMRERLLECCDSDWTGISPAIFGSMFQSVMDKNNRRSLGAHYTSEKNILKLIKPLFLDSLWEEFHRQKKNSNSLKKFYDKISDLKFLDPACGCGNFLIVAYRELRLLELAILEEMVKNSPIKVQTSSLLVSVEQFFGIELEEFPSRIAQTAMWLMEHQMDQMFSERMASYFIRLPLNSGANILQGNALQVDWSTVVPRSELSYIIGNPPFVGSKLMDANQRQDLINIFDSNSKVGVLDYVCAWYMKAARYIQGTHIACAFVSTNSITQGEQVGILWEILIHKYNIKIHFAHKTFKWSNEARGKAGVSCVIICFANYDISKKVLFEYDKEHDEPVEIIVKNINPYLVSSDDFVLRSRQKPLCEVPEIGIGNKPIDGGYFLFTPSEKSEFIEKEPESGKYFKRWMGGEEFLNGIERWCLYLKDVPPDKISQMPHVVARIKSVRDYRLASKSLPTKKLAEYPTRFHVHNVPQNDYLVVPKMNSENRKYIPFGFLDKDTLASDLLLIIPDASLYHFGVLQSLMHTKWCEHVAGRLGNQIRYSKDIVYNNFPWPQGLSETTQKAIERSAQNILDIRKKFTNVSYANLYNPLTMPEELINGHHHLDKLVDSAYSKKIFKTESDRLEFLFDLYTTLNESVIRLSSNAS